MNPVSTPEVGYPAVILARAGSKGIPGKNLIPFCGKPLLAWTLEFALNSARCSSVWLSSDSPDMATLADNLGVNVIERPLKLATDSSSSDDGWLHAMDEVAKRGQAADVFVALQATSPLRLQADFDGAVREFESQELDSLFSASIFDDLTLWELHAQDVLEAVNHDPRRRVSRQDAPTPIVENGSLYMMRTDLLRSEGTRFAGRIGFHRNEPWQAFEIDSPASLAMCELLMEHYALGH